MKKSVIFSLHFLYWGPRFIILIFIFASLTTSGTSKAALYMQILNIVPSFISFYIFYLFLFPLFIVRKRIVLFIIWGLLTWIIISLLAFVLVKYISIDSITGKAINIYWGSSITPSVLFSGLVGCMFKGFLTWYSDIRIKEQLVEKNLKSELALLKAQINPHFLFNTINNIDILIEKDPKTASEYLKRLSEMMRFMLYETSTDFIPLKTELDYIKKYIELQRIRTSNEKYVNFTYTGETENLMIAPAVFIPFIENAFKHSTNKKIENAINISIENQGNDISFSCSNYFDESNTFKQEKSGLGVDLISQRLNLIYNEKHKLEITRTEDQFKVELKINTR